MHQLTRRLCGLALLALAACAAPQAPPVTAPFRPASAPIWSNAQLDLARLVGRWQQSASFAPAGSRCTPGGAEIGGRPGALTIAARLCLAGRQVQISGPMPATGPGRFMVDGQAWWVIWADTDYRTLAIATPSGAFGFILSRGGALSADRLAAAREIFDFNGYDTRLLQVY
ncbi:lipocalin family protein [Pseudotabrizicola algicola]|uniref:Lipocalin family protein n=1 Tax=Pseudotabrizicola algicola TaxID=2709381 RepID=A0A6B3RID1_9RHOB|nr:lipocalin family protein [Pseudotabrizicola algicola]NEX45770.1 lipocalin family protein [Pseudotabrizicola algicola]